MSGKRLYAIVLAAGSSSRFGSTKQLLPYDGAPLVRGAVRLAEQACADRAILVVGHEWRKVAEACRPLQGFFVNNTGHCDGMSGSIRAGLGVVSHVADALLLLLADQPLVTIEHLGELIRRWHARPDELAASRYAGVLGPPVIFPARLFDALTALEGDRGAYRILAEERQRASIVVFEQGAVDIDLPSDVTKLANVPKV